MDEGEYLLFPLFQPEQEKSDLRIVRHLLKKRVARMRANLDRIARYLKYQVCIVDGRSQFSDVKIAGTRLGKMRRLSFNVLRRFQRNASIALDLQFRLRHLEEFEKEMKLWDATLNDGLGGL